MKTQLYKYDGTPLFEVIVDDTSSQDWSLMSDNRLSVSFELEECVVLTAGCYIDFDDTRFYLLNEYKPTMIYSSAWKYDLTLGDAASWLSITLALKTIDGEDAPIFKYTGSAAEHAAIIVANLNRRMGTDQWKVGSIISTENIAIDYSGKYCSDVLQEIVDAKNTEWWIDGMTLNIGRAEFGESITLGYMNGVLGDIVCDMAGDMRSYAYLFPIGSTRNIDPTKYGHDRLQLPSGLKSVPINPEQGVAELVEEAAFAHIYPRYEGTVSAVRYAKATNEDGTPFLIYYIKDTAIPFNPNEYEIAGLVKHITFNSGELMGQEFEVNYSADSNEFELITRWTGDIQLPGGVLVPAVGDKYVVWNISMPDVYYTIASHELLDAARAYAADAIKDVSVYKVKLDYIDVQERGLKLRPGQRVRLQSDEYFASGYYDSRITRITRNISYPDELSVDISAVRVVGTLSRLQASIQKTENVVAQFSGQLPAIIKSNDDTSADDSSVYTSAKSEKEFLNKRKGGKVAAPITFDEVAEFLNGLVAHKYIKIGNGYLRYNDELGVWEMEGDLAVTGNVAWFASIKGFKLSTIMDAVQVDGETIVKNELGQLKAIGGGSGGSGGGLTVSDLSNYLTTNKYTKQSDVETLISTALTPYALTAAIPTNNNQLSNGAGYITAAALGGYATQSWVEGKKYLTGITSSQVTNALGFTPYDSANPDKYIKGIDYDMVIAALGYTPYSTTNPMGYLTISSLLGYATEQWVGDNYLASSNFTKANIKSTLGISDWALAATKPSYTAAEVGALATSGGIITADSIASFTIYRNNGVYSAVHFYNTQDGNMTDVGYLGAVSDGRPVYLNSGGRVFDLIHSNNIGSYNAGSSTKLATPRTIWGQSFDGTGDVNGQITNHDSLVIDAADYYNSYWSRGLVFLANGVEAGGVYGFGADKNLSDIIITASGGRSNGQGIMLFKNGNVSIGIADAEAKLHVHGNARIDGDVLGSSLTNYYTATTASDRFFVGSGAGGVSTAGLLHYVYDDSPIMFWNNGFERMRVASNGNVAIGGTTADAKLHVHGDAKVDGTIIVNPSVASDVSITFRSGTASDGLYDYKVGKFTDVNGKSAFGIGMAKADGSYEKFLGISTGGVYDVTSVDIMTNTTINGNLLVNGNVSWISQSQRSLKDITSEQGLSLAQLERIKPIKFYWKDGRDAVLHVGGVADVFDEVLPEVVARIKGVLCLNYVDAAFYVGASLIAPVLDHERRITEGERERKALKMENAALKLELAIMKQMLNQLAA